MNVIKVFSILTAVAMPLIFSGCQDDDVDKANLSVHFHPEFDGVSLNYNQDYLLNGRKIVFTKAQVYLSNFQIASTPEQTFDEVISFNPTTHDLDLGLIDVGQSDGISFYIGLDQETNHADPSTFEVSNVLSNQNDAFEHWSWNSGYRFVVLEGMLDTDVTPDGLTDDNFEFHIGSDPFYTLVDLEKNENILAGQEITYHVYVDLAKLFDGLDLTSSSDYITHTSDNIELANKVKANFTKAISVQ